MTVSFRPETDVAEPDKVVPMMSNYQQYALHRCACIFSQCSWVATETIDTDRSRHTPHDYQGNNTYRWNKS